MGAPSHSKCGQAKHRMSDGNMGVLGHDMLFTKIIIKKELVASKYNTTEICI